MAKDIYFYFIYQKGILFNDFKNYFSSDLLSVDSRYSSAAKKVFFSIYLMNVFFQLIQNFVKNDVSKRYVLCEKNRLLIQRATEKLMS